MGNIIRTDAFHSRSEPSQSKKPDLVDVGQRQMDLSPWGPNILPMGGEKPEQDPFCGEVPDDRQGYAAYKKFYEQKMEDMYGDQGFFTQHVTCDERDEHGRLFGRRIKEEHRGANMVIACNHVIFQDEHNPEGIQFYPLHRNQSQGYFLCKTCVRLMEKHKLNFATQLNMKCAKCVLESALRIAKEHPDRLVNLMEM